MAEPTSDISRMRRELGARIEGYFQQQEYLHRVLSSMRRLSDQSLGSPFKDISDLIGRLGDAQAQMRVDFAEERQALHAVETALHGIRARLARALNHEAGGAE